MELKVWVDGIQRVVCGASYSTTCQDVVLALASAMGRTGRFTLVEKWRDSERPLFPNEYPLQSLHKWGEYAGEIRFLLVHAETDLNKQQDLGQQRKKSQVQTANSVVNRNNPPELSQRHLKLSEVESLKRSSTFSCALRTNFAALPSSLSSGQKSASLSQPTYYQQSSISGSTSSIRPRPTGLVSVPNGKVTPLSSVSSSDSSPRSSSTSLRYHPQSKLFRGQSSEQRPIPSARGDARELHPANMPDASSSYSVQTKDFPYYSTAFNQYSSSSSTIVPSRQLQPPIQHPHPRHLSRPDPLPSTQVHQTHSTFRVPSSALLGSQSLHSQQPQQSNPQRLQSQKPYPQHDKSEYVLSDQSHQSDGSQQYFNKSDHSQLYAKSGQSQHYFPPSGQSQQLNYIRPDVQRQLSSSSEEHTKITSPNLKQHKERAHYRKSHINKSDAPSAESQNPTRPVVNYAKSKLNNDSLIENTKYRRLNDRVIDDDGVNDLHNGSNHLQSENSSHKIQNSYNSSTQEKLPPKGSIELHTDNRPATLDRRNTRPKVNKELPSRSLSTGDQSDKQKENYLHPEFGLNQHIQGEGGNGLTHEDSSTLRQQKSSTGGSNSKLSSFTSAVAYIRNHSDSVKSFKPTINNLSSKADSQTGKRILDNSQVHGSNGREVFHSGTATSEATQPLDNKSGSITNGHSIPPHLQTSVTPPVSFNSISTFQHKSAFSEVSPKSSHHEISPLPSVPVRLNPDQANVLDNNYQRQNNQTSLEVEEYDLDQNFPDILHGQVPVTRHADGDYGLTTFLKERLEHGVKSSQVEGERMQLLRTVQVQQERIKTQEAQIDDASVEIAALEQEESGNQAKLEALASEICQLEKQEAEVRVELEDLEATDWLNAVSVEQRRESDIKIQLTSIQEKQAQIEAQVKQLFAEADHKSKELELEEQRINQENKNNEELEKKAHLQIAELTDQLTSLDKAVDEKSRRLSDIEAKILEMDATLGQKEEMVKAIKKELQVENLEVLQPSPLPKEQVSNDVPAVSIPPSPIGPMSTSDNGEAILKILEGRLSPRSTSFPSGDGGDSLEGVTSAQHNYKSAMAVKNPNGVWV